MSQIEIELPGAPPDAYLGWMAFWREVEQKMGGSPALADLASKESGPFIEGEIADFLSTQVVAAITSQALEAQNAGLDEVKPVVTADVDKLRDAVQVVARRVAWMTDERCRAMGIDPLAPRLVELRAATLLRVNDHLQRSI